MIFHKKYPVRNGNKEKGEIVTTIPIDFVSNNQDEKNRRVYMFMNKKDELIVSFNDIRGEGLYRQTKKPLKIRKTGSSYVIGLPLSFTERNRLEVFSKLEMELKKGRLVIRPAVSENEEEKED